MASSSVLITQGLQLSTSAMSFLFKDFSQTHGYVLIIQGLLFNVLMSLFEDFMQGPYSRTSCKVLLIQKFPPRPTAVFNDFNSDPLHCSVLTIQGLQGRPTAVSLLFKDFNLDPLHHPNYQPRPNALTERSHAWSLNKKDTTTFVLKIWFWYLFTHQQVPAEVN